MRCERLLELRFNGKELVQSTARTKCLFSFLARLDPDAVVWPGRRLLACVDAMAWPAAVTALVLASVHPTGIMGAFVLALAGLLAATRLHRALLHNQRYRFTTWVWGGRLAAVSAFGLALKLALQWA
jgi:hypothetical protein